MNKKIVIICTILAILLVMAIGFVCYKLFLHSEPKVVVNDSRIDVIQAVPSDAILLYDFNSLSDVKAVLNPATSNIAKFFAKDGSFAKFISFIPSEFEDAGALFSVHYSSKNRVSPLFVLSLSKIKEKENLIKLLTTECDGVSQKNYNGIIIYRSISPLISFSVYGNYLLVSTSDIILESSLRHLENKTSMLDNSSFVAISKNISGNSSIYLNHTNLGKLFSGIVTRPYLDYAGFASDFASWTIFDVSMSSTELVFNGKIFNNKSDANFSSVFLKQKNRVSDVYDYLPFNTNYVVSIPISDINGYLSSYKSYIESNKKINNYNYTNAIADKSSTTGIKTFEWVSSMGVKEIAFASIVKDNNKNENIVLIKASDVTAMKNFDGEVCKYLFPGYISAVFGDFFTPSFEESYCIVSDWIVIGSTKVIKYLSSKYSNEKLFTLSDYILQTPISKTIGESAAMSVVINLSACTDSVSAIFKEKYSTVFTEGLKSNNCQFITAKLINDGGQLKFDISLLLDNLAELPTHRGDNNQVGENIVDNTPLVVPKGPFEVKNFIDGSTNYLEQLPNHKLRLLYSNKKGVWTIPFSEPLCGFVSQIDYMKNGKLQMVFAAGSKIYLMDRLGRFVKPYPVDLKRDIALGPKIFDFENDKNYSMMILHRDNKIGMYDISGKKKKGWSEISINEKIKTFPELLEVKGNIYWILRTSSQTLIFNNNGTAIAEFTKKRRLKSDTEIEIKSSNEVIVTTIEDKKMLLNLETGVFSKL